MKTYLWVDFSVLAVKAWIFQHENQGYGQYESARGKRRALLLMHSAHLFNATLNVYFKRILFPWPAKKKKKPSP